jgi:hypothetical protein
MSCNFVGHSPWALISTRSTEVEQLAKRSFARLPARRSQGSAIGVMTGIWKHSFEHRLTVQRLFSSWAMLAANSPTPASRAACQSC